MFHGDINLSCTMTFLSTVSSFAFTSLWVYLLGTPLVGKTIPIPYPQIAISLASFTVPLLLGVAVKVCFYILYFDFFSCKLFSTNGQKKQNHWRKYHDLSSSWSCWSCQLLHAIPIPTSSTSAPGVMLSLELLWDFWDIFLGQLWLLCSNRTNRR